MRYTRPMPIFPIVFVTLMAVGSLLAGTGCEKSQPEGKIQQAAKPQKNGVTGEPTEIFRPVEEITGPPLNLVTAIMQVAK